MLFNRITKYTVLGAQVTIPANSRSLIILNTGLTNLDWDGTSIPPGSFELPEKPGRLYDELKFTSTADNPVIIIVYT